jgi:Xaa-Pro aminopeptidase
MQAAARAVRPGQTEHQIAGLLAREVESRGVQVIVNLIATDERIFSFRHPLPTGKKLEKYAMLILCGRQRGLVCSVTRLVHFGKMPDDLRHKSEAVAQIDATFIVSTRPGKTMGEVFRRATEAYAETGFADEWHLHHQGGTAGYEPREQVATLEAADVVSVGQVYAWNPSITGAKSEDTILVGEKGNEVLTAMKGWPVVSAKVDGREIARPATLEIV